MSVSLPQISHFSPKPNAWMPPQEPLIGLFEKSTPTAMPATTKRRKHKVSKNTVNITELSHLSMYGLFKVYKRFKSLRSPRPKLRVINGTCLPRILKRLILSKYHHNRKSLRFCKSLSIDFSRSQ